MYVRHKTVEASRAVVEEVDLMVDIMKGAFSTSINNMAWMSEGSKQAAQQKLGGMMDLIGMLQIRKGFIRNSVVKFSQSSKPCLGLHMYLEVW